MSDVMKFDCPRCKAKDGVLVAPKQQSPELRQDLLEGRCAACNQVVDDRDVRKWVKEAAEQALKGFRPRSPGH